MSSEQALVPVSRLQGTAAEQDNLRRRTCVLLAELAVPTSPSASVAINPSLAWQFCPGLNTACLPACWAWS